MRRGWLWTIVVAVVLAGGFGFTIARAILDSHRSSPPWILIAVLAGVGLCATGVLLAFGRRLASPSRGDAAPAAPTPPSPAAPPQVTVHDADLLQAQHDGLIEAKDAALLQWGRELRPAGDGAGPPTPPPLTTTTAATPTDPPNDGALLAWVQQLRDSGQVTEEEYELMRRRVLTGDYDLRS